MRPQVPGQVMLPPAVVVSPDLAGGAPETRQEAAGSDRRDADMMGPPPPGPGARAPPPPTPGRDIAGEESGAGSAGSVFRRGDTRDRDGYDSTDDRDARDSDSDHGDRYVRRPGDRSGGQHRQSGASKI